MDYRTYHLAELLPEAMQGLAALARTGPARPEDRPPHVPPVLRLPARKQGSAPCEKKPCEKQVEVE